MSDERLIPTPAPVDLNTVTIKVNGEQIRPQYHIMAITVSKMVNKIPVAQITIADGDVAQQCFAISDSEDFIPGNEIEIQSGYHSQESTIFKGIIVSQNVKARKNRTSVLIVTCKDIAVKMIRGRKSSIYKEKKDSEIIEDILCTYGFDCVVESTDVTHKEVVRYSATDWDFIVTRAEYNCKLVFVDDGVVTVQCPDTGQDPALSLVYGATIMEFEADMSATDQIAGTKSASWDFSSQEIIEEEGDEPDISGPGNIGGVDLAEVLGTDAIIQCHGGAIADVELKAWADAKLVKSRLARIIGRVTCQGFADIKPGMVLELGGIGERFNGNAYVTGVKHDISTRNWETQIQFGLSPQWFSESNDISNTPASGLLPSVSGLQIGIVTDIASDPDNEFRVRVKIPIVDPEDEGVWARVASIDAGENRGVFFRPEIEDEVVIGFFNNDPRDPVILGLLHSSAKPAPLAIEESNALKGIVTRSEMKMLFNDEDIFFSVETPNGNKITISDADAGIVLIDENSNTVTMNSDGVIVEESNGNTITMNSDGVTVEDSSGNTISLTSSGVSIESASDMKLAAGGSFKIEASGSVTIEGSAVEVK
jgi:Rhs element Vgr protein